MELELFFVFDCVTKVLVAVTDNYDIAVSYSEYDPQYRINCISVVDSLKINLKECEYQICLM